MADRRNIVRRFVDWAINRPLSEAIPSGDRIDVDDDKFTRLTGTSRDLNPIKQERAQQIALYLWRQNPMAKRLTEIIVDFVVGDGIAFEASDRAVQDVLDEFWNDPRMNLELRHRDLVRDQSIYGELAFRVVENEVSGRCRLAFLPSERINDVTLNPENALEDYAVVVTRGIERVSIPCVRYDDETSPANPQWVGEVFYFPVNRVTGQKRGTPDMLAIADYIDGYDQLLFNSLERSALINAFVWDVELTGATGKQIEDWKRENPAAPSPGSVRVHNEKEKWLAAAPNLNNADMVTLGRSIKNMALGGAGVPEAWFADGDSANRATLAEQGDPTYKFLATRQRTVRAMFEIVGRYVVERAIARGRIPSSTDTSFVVVMPDPSTRDTGKVTLALTQAIAALTAAEEAEWVSNETAMKVFAMIASKLGHEIDPTVEAEKIKAEQEAKDAAKASQPTPMEDYENVMGASVVTGGAIVPPNVKADAPVAATTTPAAPVA